MTKKQVYYVLLLTILLVPSILGLLHPGFFVTDDGNWMIIRFSAFYQAFRYGQFPVRFLPQLNHGYGYPVSDFLYPGFMYLGIPIHLFGFGLINTIKCILAGSLISSGLFCYFWLKRVGKIWAACIGAVAYVFFPYHLYDVYHRGSVGEVLALAIIPFIFWQIERRSLQAVACGLAVLILSHNVLALLFLILITAYSFFVKKYSFFDIFVYLFLGLGLSAFFWLPAFFDKQFTVFDSKEVSDYSQYFLSSQNAELLGLVFPVILSFSSYVFFKKQMKGVGFFLFIAILACFYTVSLSAPFWNMLQLSKYVQFPFRFLSVVMLCVSYLTCVVSEYIQKKFTVLFLLIMYLLIYFSSLSFLFPHTYVQNPDSYYATNQDSTTIQNEYMPKWVKVVPVSMPSDKILSARGQSSFSDIEDFGTKINFAAEVRKNDIISVNTIYFPGWEVFADGKEKNISYNNTKGIIQFALDSGRHRIQVIFKETPFRLFADSLSLLSFLFLFVYLVNRKKNYVHI